MQKLTGAGVHQSKFADKRGEGYRETVETVDGLRGKIPPEKTCALQKRVSTIHLDPNGAPVVRLVGRGQPARNGTVSRIKLEQEIAETRERARPRAPDRRPLAEDASGLSSAKTELRMAPVVNRNRKATITVAAEIRAMDVRPVKIGQMYGDDTVIGFNFDLNTPCRRGAFEYPSAQMAVLRAFDFKREAALVYQIFEDQRPACIMARSVLLLWGKAFRSQRADQVGRLWYLGRDDHAEYGAGT